MRGILCVCKHVERYRYNHMWKHVIPDDVAIRDNVMDDVNGPSAGCVACRS